MYGTVSTRGRHRYDPEEEYESAMEALQTVKNNLPAYDARYEQSLRELYQEITNRPQFSYNPNEDALYQSYKQAYTQQGSLAMQDAMGQASGLTGGYGSSYARSVGQQQYGAYLQKLSEVYPETYAMAYGQYLDEGQRLQDRYHMVSELADEDYQRYQDRLDAYYKELDSLQKRADLAYNRGVAEEEREYDRKQDSIKQHNEAYDRLMEMIVTMGYVPDGDELNAAGMSEKHMNAYLSYFNGLQTPAGSGRRKKDEDTAEADYDSALAAARARLKKVGDVEQVNGEIAQKVAKGELSAAEGQRIIMTLTEEQYG